MEQETKCPVCGKAGINNYYNEDIVCPCCGSDLSIFRVIDNVSDSNSKKGIIWKIVSCVLFMFAFVLSVLCFNYSTSINHNKEQLAQVNDSLVEMKSQVLFLKKDLLEMQNAPIHVTCHKHIVLPGDNLWRISRRYYGKGTRYKEIAEWNNIPVNAYIAPGDTILIK